MKRYIVFWGDIYYASGGMKDSHKYFEDFELAVQFAEGVLTGRGPLTWVHVYDAEDDKVVYENEEMK